MPGFSASADNTVQKLDLDGGFLYMGGSFTTVNGTARDAVARVAATTGVLDVWAPDVEIPAGAAFGFTRSMNDIDVVNGVVILSGAFETVGGQTRLGVATVDTATGAPTTWAPQLGTPPLGGFGGAILTYSDLTVIGGARIQLADELLNGLALFIEPVAARVLPPTAFTATIAGSTITFRWALSPLGLSGVSFVLEAGTGPGLRNIGTLPVGGGTSFSVPGVPPGTYYVRMRSVHALGTSAPSPEIAVTVGGVGCVSPPQPPGAFDYQYDDGIGLLQLDWSAGPGEPPTGFILQAGSQPGSSNIAVVPLGPATSLVIPGVPPGAYWLRMLASNACGISAPSPDFPLFVGITVAAPLAPLGLTATVAGGVVQISWVEPPFLPVTGYILEAGSAPGLSNLASVPVPGTTFSVAGVPPGVYYLRVRAVNALGTGGPSAEFILIVP